MFYFYFYNRNDDEPFIKMVEEDMKADGLPQGYTRDGQPKSGTLTNMLLQALNSGDQALLDEVAYFITELYILNL